MTESARELRPFQGGQPPSLDTVLPGGNRTRSRSLWGDALRRLGMNRGAVFSTALLVLMLIPVFFAAQIAPYDPIQMDPNQLFMPPSAEHWFGTDQYGRDILSRIIHGTKYSFQLGFISVGIAAFFGVILGLIAGYYGAWADSILMRLIDIMLAFPGILMALVVVAVLGPSLNNAMIAVGVSAIPSYTRLVRGSILAAKSYVYVEAARAVGCRDFRIVMRHLLPNIVAPIIVFSTLGIALAIITGSSLSFLGLGAQPPTPEWGAMLSTGRDYLRRQPWISTFPGLAIMVTVLAINLLGDGLRDALDPRMKM